MSNNGNKNRKNSLDALRTIAIVLVINCHIASFYARQSGESGFTRLLGMGGHGVDLFFVLSGWLLGSILLKELRASGTLNIRRFILRRWLRTFPAYYAILMATYGQLFLSQKLDWNALSFLVFAQNYAYDSIPFFTISWSLCVEEHFYLLIAIVFMGCRQRSHLLLFSLASFLIAANAFRYTGLNTSDIQTHVRVDQCAAGVCLAFLYHFYPTLWKKFQRHLPKLIFASILALAFLSLNRLLSLGLPEPLNVFTFSSVVAIGLAERSTRHRSFKIPLANYLATRSYSLYLVHVEALALIRKLEIEGFTTILVSTWLISLIAAEGLYRVVELPGMRLREHRMIKRLVNHPERTQ